jgi:hypothetical protein
MGKLVHLTNVSLDRSIEDEYRSLEWETPRDKLFVRTPR